MKNQQLVQETKERICQALDEVGFKAYGMAPFSSDKFPLMKDLATYIVSDPNIYGFLVHKNLIHFDHCLLCGEHLTQTNTFNFTLFGRYYYMCTDCYEQNVPAHKRVKEGCYIATACYGSYDHSDVLVLRQFRDNVLSRFILGVKFINLYYRYSPTVAAKLKPKTQINEIIKFAILKPVVWLVSIFK